MKRLTTNEIASEHGLSLRHARRLRAAEDDRSFHQEPIKPDQLPRIRAFKTAMANAHTQLWLMEYQRPPGMPETWPQIWKQCCKIVRALNAMDEILNPEDWKEK